MNGILEFGRDKLVEHADELLLHQEADKCADAIHAMGRGETPYDEAEWDRLIARFSVLLAAINRDPDAFKYKN